MANLRSSIFWTLLLSSLFLAFECSNIFNYDVVYDFVPLSVVKRESPITNSIKPKAADGNSAAATKLDKNSASTGDLFASPSSVKKALAPTDELTADAEKDDDDVIKHFVNDTEAEKPKVLHDHHLYYNSTIVTETDKIDAYWVDLEKMSQEKVITHDMLSKSYRRAATVSLTFDFPFYGHLLRNATIATGGFLYLGDYMHSWLASTQYIAPLMANFDTRLDDKSVIKYADNGTDFIVQWEYTYLQDHYHAGPFTFQARLRSSGDIVFAYKNIPVTIASIPDGEHPVRVGVSDAYIIDRTLIRCITLKDCESCVTSLTTFRCAWCEQAHRCSDGMDRQRHDWLMRGCDTVTQTSDDRECPVPATSASVDRNVNVSEDEAVSSAPVSAFTLPSSSSSANLSLFPNSDIESFAENDSVTFNSHLQNLHSNHDAGFFHSRGRSFGAAGIIGILFVVAIVVGFVSWLIYAYKFPHSPSGQIIIKYRPSQWHWSRGEADYTPASVHI